MYEGHAIVAQVAEDISREVIKRADAVRRNKNAIVQSFVKSEKEAQPSCCSLEPHGFSVDARFPGKVTTTNYDIKWKYQWLKCNRSQGTPFPTSNLWLKAFPRLRLSQC